ncbi:MAG: type VI secretion system protein TssA [Candidatus Paracaedimonas acanthamoebae]|uniref:Type VI secretion system protein TssA n=1 Tax=Candidatus Paracaedimonas acanthamoebae TaxID=244581 RepID=A0A8J7TV48_9PROT|nr:type VI secretion system protein TssA [Candidatus Paracaedimonas acanthamoebae]
MILGLEKASKQISSLLTPLKGKEPSGRYLQYEHHYDQLRNARIEEDEALSLGIWQRELKKADWGKVEELACSILQNDSKDLQVAAWLTDAWLRLYGMKGLELGITLCLGLCKNFWTTLHPQIQKEDIEYRLAPLEWLNEKLLIPLRLMAITHTSHNKNKGYTYTDYEIAARYENTLKMGHEAAQKSKITQNEPSVKMSQFLQSQSQTPAEFYEDLVNSCQNTIKIINELEIFILQKCSNYPSILNLLRQEIKKLEDFSTLTLKKREPFHPPSLSGKNEDEKPEEKPSKIASSINLVKKIMKKDTPQTITNREQAYQMLAEISDYLAKVEPHSPTPYLIRRAVSWGDMSLSELLAELIQDGGDLIKTLKILGIPPVNNQNSKEQDSSY